jgi:hypothetical protein
MVTVSGQPNETSVRLLNSPACHSDAEFVLECKSGIFPTSVVKIVTAGYDPLELGNAILSSTNIFLYDYGPTAITKRQ